MSVTRTAAADLARALAAAAAHRAPGTEIEFDAIRLDAAPGGLTAIATDRYTLAAAHAAGTTYSDRRTTAVLDAGEADRLLADARRLAGLAPEVEVAVSIDTGEHAVSLICFGSRIEKVYKTDSCNEDLAGLDWAGAVDKALDELRPDAPVHLDSTLLARYAAPRTRMQVIASGALDADPTTARAALVTVEDWLVGVIAGTTPTEQAPHHRAEQVAAAITGRAPAAAGGDR